MEIRPFTLEQSDLLVDILVSEEWEFHSGPPLTEEIVGGRISSGFFTDNGRRTFLIFDQSDQGEIPVGFFRLFDLGSDKLDDETPLFDIRLRKKVRNKGIGTWAVRWLVEHVFTTYPNKNRIEATTRHDNIAMRRTLEGCGFAKEAHYRQCWPGRDGIKVDTVGYGILRSDWEAGRVTPVEWND